MLVENGAQRLEKFTRESFAQQVTQVTAGVWHVLGMGHSNAIFIEGQTGVILVDTLDTLERGTQLRQCIAQHTGKVVHTIFYTHSHPDHRGGAGAFAQDQPESFAFAPKSPLLARTEALEEVQGLRGNRQFGYSLTQQEAISQGIGIREGITEGQQRAFVPPTHLLAQDALSLCKDGVQLELLRLPGESEDQMALWLPGQRVLCCGDNFYGCWPNFYAIRGSQYRDIAGWIASLEVLRGYSADILLPGHNKPWVGKEQIAQVLGNFIGAANYVLNETLAGMNRGQTADELAATIALPPEYRDLPYLGEFYGCVDWTVRAIYAGYLGWFCGNPTQLHPLPPAERAKGMVALMGGAGAVDRAAQSALEQGQAQWCCELCDLLLEEAPTGPARGIKAQALRQLAGQETSANGRHYYLACAHQLEKVPKE